MREAEAAEVEDGIGAPAIGRFGGWLVLSFAWLIPVALAATQDVARTQLSDTPDVGWFRALLFQLPLWSPLAVLTPPIIWFVHRYPFDRLRAVRSGLILVSGALGFSLVFLPFSAAASTLVEGRGLAPDVVASAVGALAVRVFHLNLFMVAAVMGIGHAMNAGRRLRERELLASRLRGQLSEAQLATLKAQLQPHFLFNTLHSISSLMDDDVPRAREMMEALGDLLRYSLEGSSKGRVPLEKELEWVHLYLDIERIRFQDRLTIRETVEPRARFALVPAFLLQPIVENAIRHGIARAQDSGLLEIDARVVAGTLEIEIADDGAGLSDEGAERLGIGLGHTGERLQQEYGPAASLRLEAGNPRGAKVTVSLPFRPGSVPATRP